MRQLILFLGVFVGLAASSSKQVLRCWDLDGENGGDPGLVLEQDTAINLANFEWDFDNRISSCCGVGTWILYDYGYYNGIYGHFHDASFVVTSQVSGSEFCTDLPANLTNKPSSIRYSSHSKPILRSTLPFFI